MSEDVTFHRNGKEVIRITVAGVVYICGRLVVSDKEIADGLRALVEGTYAKLMTEKALLEAQIERIRDYCEQDVIVVDVCVDERLQCVEVKGIEDILEN